MAVSFDVAAPGDLGVDDAKLVSLVSNMLDNAVAGATAVMTEAPDRTACVSFRIVKKEGMLYFFCENDCNESSLVKTNDGFLSSKKTKKKGLGMLIVSDIVKEQWRRMPVLRGRRRFPRAGDASLGVAMEDARSWQSELGTLRCAVLDDDPASGRRVGGMAAECLRSLEARVRVSVFAHVEDLLAAGLFDVYLLDIVLHDDECTGMELAWTLRERHASAQIVFFTNNVEYAVEGYDVEAAGFLPKPVSREGLLSTMRRIVARRKDFGEIVIPTAAGVLRVALEDVDYAEVLDHDILIHTSRGEVERFSMTLTRLFEMLPAGQFVRCHRSYVARLGAIRSIRRYVVRFKSGAEIPMSKARYGEVQNALLDRAAIR